MTQFQINKYLTLRLEDGKTNIYVDDTKVLQCKYLLLNIPLEDVEKYDEVNSIDHAAELLNKDMEIEEPSREESHSIPPETEFWAHSSNLQAWAENNYDTRLLHSNLSFPLLKKLTEAGDPVARKVFKKEIAARFKSGYMPVMVYLVKEGYLNHFDWDESEELYSSLDYKKLRELRKKVREYHRKRRERFIVNTNSKSE